MKRIFAYSCMDLMRSRWTIIYFGFYLILGFALLWLSSDLAKVIVSLMNVVLMLVPLIATMFSILYVYNSREFVELLLAQPIPRTHIFLGQYLGMAASLSLSLALGLGLPFLLYGILYSSQIGNYLVLLGTGILLSCIFSAIAFWLALKFENRLRGFSVAMLLWLFFAMIYDGIFLICLSMFREYPLDHFALGVSLFNPIDLSRILILLKLDAAALMGYTGAVFQRFLGTTGGLTLAWSILLIWLVLPVFAIRRLALSKDF